MALASVAIALRSPHLWRRFRVEPGHEHLPCLQPKCPRDGVDRVEFGIDLPAQHAPDAGLPNLVSASRAVSRQGILARQLGPLGGASVGHQLGKIGGEHATRVHRPSVLVLASHIRLIRMAV
jgi:hypothetical protein